MIHPSDPHRLLRSSFLGAVGDEAHVLAVFLPRERVQALDLSMAVAPLHVAHEEEVVARACGSVRLVFEGYERDPRPLDAIGEVRRFAAALDHEAPALLFFLEREQRAAFARCVLDPGGAAVEAAHWAERKRDAVLGLGRAYGFDAAAAWDAIAVDLAGDAGTPGIE